MKIEKIKMCTVDGYLITDDKDKCHVCKSDSLRNLSDFLNINTTFFPVFIKPAFRKTVKLNLHYKPTGVNMYELFDKVADNPNFLSIRNGFFCQDCGEVNIDINNNNICESCGSIWLSPLRYIL